MGAWYQTDRGENIEGQGVAGCMARLFLKHMIGHVLIDMDNMTKLIEQDAHDNLQWQMISFPGTSTYKSTFVYNLHSLLRFNPSFSTNCV